MLPTAQKALKKQAFPFTEWSIDHAGPSNGLRNRDLRGLLFPTEAASPKEQRRRSAAITRKLRLLRAHGLIQKVPKTHRYVVSTKGQQVITTVLAARDANADLLTTNAA